MSGFLKEFNRYRTRYQKYKGRMAKHQDFVGTFSSIDGLVPTLVPTSIGYDYVYEFSTTGYRFRLIGYGKFTGQLMIVGAGDPGSAASSPNSGAGGAGGTITYFPDYEFQIGVTYGVIFQNTSSYSGDVVLNINPDSYPNPPYQEIFRITPGGGSSGGSSVTGNSDGINGGQGTLSSITGVTISYGGGGGSGASIGPAGGGLASQNGGLGTNGYNTNPRGDGGDASRYADGTLNSADNGENGGNYGAGGGGGASVWARPQNFPLQPYQYWQGSGARGGRGRIIIRFNA